MTVKMALDVDGTLLDLLEDVQRIEWMDPIQVREATRVRPEARAWLHQLADMVPTSIIYLTARGQHLRELTCAQLWTFPRGRLYCYPAEDDFDLVAAARYKADVLKHDRPAVMIGDRLLDEQAARLAHTHYVDEAKWLRTDPDEFVELLVDEDLIGHPVQQRPEVPPP